MRFPNWVLAAKCSDRWMGIAIAGELRESPTTSEEATIFDKRLGHADREIFEVENAQCQDHLDASVAGMRRQ